MRLVRVQVRKRNTGLQVVGTYRTNAGRRVRKVIAKDINKAELEGLFEQLRLLEGNS